MAKLVQEAKITIRYHDMVAREGSKDFSTEELPAKIQRSSTLEQDTRGRSSFHQPKVVVHHQSLHSESGVPTSLRPLVREETGITALILGNFHICMDHKVTSMNLQGNEGNSSATMYLNDFALDDPDIEDIWVDVKYLQAEGVKVIGMLNMYGVDSLGSCDDLTFERSYNVLHDVVVSRGLDGFNLDTEVRGEVVNAEDERMSLQAINRLIDRLNTDFGSNFIIVMTASAEALLSTDGNQKSTEIDYRALETQRGHLISWYNVRIFSSYERSGGYTNEIRLPRTLKGIRVGGGPDEHRDPASNFVRELNLYIRLLQHGVYGADKILMAVSTTPNVCDGTVRDHGPYIDSLRLRGILELLRWSYSPVAFGGVAGWEYSPVRGSTTVRHPGGSRSPWLWAKETRAILESVFL